MSIKEILKELEKQKDKKEYLKKLLLKIKNKKLHNQIQELIKVLEEKEKQTLEDKLTAAPLPRAQLMQSLREEAFQEEPKYKSKTFLPRDQIIIPRTPEEIDKDNIYKKGNQESYLAETVRNPIKKRRTESYEVNHIESIATTEAKESVRSQLKETMSEKEMIEYIRELEDKNPKYTTGTAQLEQEPIFNPKKKKIHEEYK